MLLKLGSKGEDVKKLQQKLGIGADGSFGPGTEKAVKEWQSKNGLKADGIIGDASWSRLFASESSPSPSAPAPVVESGAPLSFINKLRGHIPDAVFAQIPSACAAFNINSPLRLAHFLAQCGHESGGFKAVSENLNYSADGLKKIFGKYFPGDTSAYARNPEKIASNYLYCSHLEVIMSLDKELFDGKTLSDLFSEIYKNTDSKRQQINQYVASMVKLIRTPEDAAIIGPVIKDFIEVNVKNDEHLVRVAQIAQRIVGAASKGENIDGLLSEAEKQALLGDLKMEVEKLEDEGKEIEEDIFAISKRIK